MNQINTLINLFGGPEVSIYKDLALVGITAFTVGISHPPIDLYYLNPGKRDTLQRGGLRTIPIPKNFASFEEYEKFLETNFSSTSSFPMERQRWARSIQMSISDYFAIPLSRVAVTIKPQGEDDELVNTKSMVYVRIKDLNYEIKPTVDQYVQGMSQHYPYKSRRRSIYDATDANDYKIFDENGKCSNFGNVLNDDNQFTRAASPLIDNKNIGDIDVDVHSDYVKKQGAYFATLQNSPPMYNKTIYNKKTGAKKTTLVMIPDAYAYHSIAVQGIAVRPEDIEKAKLLWENLVDVRKFANKSHNIENTSTEIMK